jgi:hypothetical protein
MQDVVIGIGEALLVFALLGIGVVFILERLLIYRRREYRKKTQSFLDIINQK